MPEKWVIPARGDMRVPAEIYTDHRLPTDPEAVRQLCAGAALSGVVRVIGTPDIHRGYGVPIGCVLGMEEAVVPAAAGFDINCGMQLLATGTRFEPDTIRRLAQDIHRVVPLGEGRHNLVFREEDFLQIVSRGLEGLASVRLDRYPFYQKLSRQHTVERAAESTESGGSLPADIASIPPRAVTRGIRQLGTLGGGNHFVEIQEVESVLEEETAVAWGLRAGDAVIMIHSGSRGFGHELAGTWMRGNRLMALTASSDEGQAYLNQMRCAANFAYANRFFLTSLIAGVLERVYHLPAPRLVYDVAHNMVSVEEGLYVHRKGATRALGPSVTGDGRGQVVLIPGSMGTRSYVLAGCDGAAETLRSVNHGAGRIMGRRQAMGVVKKGKVLRAPGVTEKAFREAMSGIDLICENERRIREEAPQVYKDLEVVTDVVEHFNLARRVARLKPLAVLKG